MGQRVMTPNTSLSGLFAKSVDENYNSRTYGIRQSRAQVSIQRVFENLKTKIALRTENQHPIIVNERRVNP
jgi:hypothetical protein